MNYKQKIVILKTTDGKLVFNLFGYHKLLLAIFGALLDGTRGAITGLIIGCFFDMNFIKKIEPPKHADLRLNFLMLGAFILQVTGLEAAFSPDIIRNRLTYQFGEVYVDKRMNFFRDLLRQRIQVEKICDQLKSNASLDEKISLFKFLFEISSHPNLNNEQLIKTVEYLATRIELDSKYIKQLSAEYAAHKSGSSSNYRKEYAAQKQDAYTLFGLTSTCNEKELKKAYHTLAKKYHPDAHPDLNLTEKNNLQEKFRRITEVYEKLKEARGWK